MRSRLKLGSIGGVPVYLTSGWVLIAIVLIVVFAPTVQGILGVAMIPAAAVAAGVPVLLAVSVLLHELAHGLTAQRFGETPREYVLSLWGGHTAFDSQVARPGVSALVAVAGPATNGVLAVGFWLASGAVDAPALRFLLGAAAYTNAFVAVFNALPALPMDGGRLLEALIWKVRDDRDLGTLVAARVGQGVAVLVALGAIARVLLIDRQSWFTAVWGILIASMLWQGATASVRVATARRSARNVDLTAWAQPVTVLAPDAPVATLAGVTSGVVLLAGPDGVPRAQVLPDAVAAVPQAARGTTPLAAVAVRLQREALLTEHRGTEAVAQLARAAQAGARTVVLVGLDLHAFAALDVVDAGRRLPH